MLIASSLPACVAGGLAILCALPVSDADKIIEANALRYSKMSTMDLGRVRAAMHEGQKRGVAFHDGLVFPGVAFPADDPIAVISVVAISARLDPVRRAIVAAALQRHARRMTQALAGSSIKGWKDALPLQQRNDAKVCQFEK